MFSLVTPEKLESEKLNVAEVTQSEIAQKQKLQTVLEKINETLKLPPRSIKWNVDSVHAKSLVAILHLLVALSQYFRAPIRLPDHVSIQVVVVQKREGILQSRQYDTSKAFKRISKRMARCPR